MNIVKTIKFIYLLHNSRTTFRDIIEFLHKEIPPENNNYLSIVKSNSIFVTTKTDANKNNKLLFSVILTTYNRSHMIKSALDSLIGQKGIRTDEYEIIIVNDGSKDKTDKAVKDYMNCHKNLKITLITLSVNRGSSYARNLGILNSSSNLIALTDDDCVAPPDWLFNFKRSFEQNPDIIAVGGWKIPYRKEKNCKPSIYDSFIYWRRQPYMAHKYKSAHLSPFNNCGDTANVCYKKTALIKIGGFNHYLRTWYDWELKMRIHFLGYPLLFCPHHVLHTADLTFKRYSRQILLLGWDCFLISRLHPNLKFFKISFFEQICRAYREIEEIEREKYFKTLPASVLNRWLFSFYSFIFHINFWLGRYWVPIFILKI